MALTYYHVVAGEWDGGDLCCYEWLEERGEAPAWKWPEAPVGFDGHLVCVFETLDAARDFVAEWISGPFEILQIDAEPIANEVRWKHNDEGYLAACWSIPAKLYNPLQQIITSLEKGNK